MLEAMSYGVSCIASDIPAHRNVGLGKVRLFKTGSISGLAEKMKELMNKTMSAQEKATQIKMISEKEAKAKK